MTLTKKHFIKIAELINRHNNGEGHLNIEFVKDLTDYFESLNLKFDKKKFLKACGFEEQESQDAQELNENYGVTE